MILNLSLLCISFMARPLRIEYPVAYDHVTSRGNERKAIFRDDADREKFLELLERLTYGLSRKSRRAKGFRSSVLALCSLQFSLLARRRPYDVAYLIKGRRKPQIRAPQRSLLDILPANPVRDRLSPAQYRLATDLESVDTSENGFRPTGRRHRPGLVSRYNAFALARW